MTDATALFERRARQYESADKKGFRIDGDNVAGDIRAILSHWKATKVHCASLEEALERAIEVLEFAYMNAPKQPKEIAQGRAVLQKSRGGQ